MNLQSEDKSSKALTVGSLNVLGGIKSDELTSIHTHLQSQDGVQSRIIADMQKLYESISSDGVITANEKQLLKKELTIIETEYPLILAKAEEAQKPRADITAYKEAYRALIDYLYNDIRIFDDMSSSLSIDREIFNKHFAAYYKQRAVLQIAKDGKPADMSFPSDGSALVHPCFEETPQARAAAEPSYTAWQSRIIEYDCTGKGEIVMTFAEALNAVIILSGELQNDITLRLFFDPTNGNGAKQYQIVYKLTGNYTLTITSGIQHTQAIVQSISEQSYGAGCYAVIDTRGNVWHFKGEKGAGGVLSATDRAASIDDEDFFLIEKERAVQKVIKTDALVSIQRYDSPIGEVKIFYDGEYKHGFLEANGLPFSPDVFPEFTAYVKRVFNTGADPITGWPLRPKLAGQAQGTKVFLKAVQGV